MTLNVVIAFYIQQLGHILFYKKFVDSIVRGKE